MGQSEGLLIGEFVGKVKSNDGVRRERKKRKMPAEEFTQSMIL